MHSAIPDQLRQFSDAYVLANTNVEGFAARVVALYRSEVLWERLRQAAMSRLRRDNSHLALVTSADDQVTAMVTLEDLVEDLVGTVRDGTHRV